jgi:hypothetical protein
MIKLSTPKAYRAQPLYGSHGRPVVCQPAERSKQMLTFTRISATGIKVEGGATALQALAAHLEQTGQAAWTLRVIPRRGSPFLEIGLSLPQEIMAILPPVGASWQVSEKDYGLEV